MKMDLLLLTLHYGLAFTAFVGAINARGPIRVILSYFFAILTLCLAVFHTSQYMIAGAAHGGDVSAQSNEASVIPAPGFNADSGVSSGSGTEPGSLGLPQAAVPVEPAIPAVDTAALTLSKNQAAIGESKNDLKGVLEVARRISRNLSALNLGSAAEISDEEYESLQNKAVGYLSEARRTKEKLAPMLTQAPEAVKVIGESLNKGVEALIVAGFNAERFFKSENDTEEKAHLAAFNKGNQNALAWLKKAGTSLDSDASALSADAGE